ncbi:Isochorismatase hydrolase [Trichoderma citrinoviride]|uniref:nicotinamidase n=1 Tax=Trichoderma citrinoviride TaxID=58853 RepID=A0A2T4BEC8_9HYPO|nr:Isochorismatase hydrolase [Trichoderma citrinoviride]PTB67690.1 Isochorismatase hydrolase [Trichoderma citrinoviride]
MASDSVYKPALIIVDFQEDFCPPNGSLAVPQGRDIAPVVNSLLTLPFALKLATRDWHPPNHISFAENHPGAEPLKSYHTIVHPTDPTKSDTTLLWPRHCVQGTQGAELVPELDVDKVDEVLDKGLDARVEMYSAFWDPMRVSVSSLGSTLRSKGVTDVFVVGLAADYCVKATAVSAVEEGYRTFIVEEGTRPVMKETWEKEGKKEVEAKGVKIVSVDGEEIARVRRLA